MKTGEHGQLTAGGNRVSREKKSKLRAISKMPPGNHVFCAPEPQKLSATGSDRCLLELPGAETEV